ncbi:MAG: DHH family phosphoesterase [Thermoplasmataceae archaeon]
MLKDIIDQKLYELLYRGSTLIRNSDYVRVIAHYDGDGTSAAMVICAALKRLNIKFHLGYIKNLDGENFRRRIEEDPDRLAIIVDAGSDQAQYVPDIEKLIILDHHFYNKSTIKGLNINARDFGIDGTREACGSTMAFLMALVLDEGNRDLYPFFISGAIADKQDIGGLRGINETLGREYGKDYETVHTLNLEGGKVKDAITYSTDPFFSDLTGNPENVNGLLSRLGIDPESSVYDLQDNDKSTLSNALAAKLISQNVGLEAMKYLENDIVRFNEIGYSSKEISSIVDGNSKIGKNSIPVQYFLGDESVKDEMISNWRISRTKLIEYTYRVLKDIYEQDSIRYFYAPEGEMTGSISGILSLYLLKQDKPLIGFNAGSENTKVSSRGTRKLVQMGLNLSVVMREAATQVGGSGGGHDIAAGAVIPRGKEKQFVEIANDLVKGQLSGATT